MKKLCVLFAVCFLTASAVLVQTGLSKVETEKKVMAFYYPWYGTPEISGAWSHWEWTNDKPNELDPQGRPNLKIAFHPESELYDSNDPALIRRHLKLAEEAGIDVLISSWWGIGDFTDKALEKVLDVIEETGSPVRMSVYYETVPGRNREKGEKDFEYLIEKYGGRKSFFKTGGAPVVFIYGRAMFDLEIEDWTKLVKNIKKKSPVLLMADQDFFAYFKIFDGIHRYNPVGEVKGGKRTDEIYSNLMKIGRQNKLVTAVTVIPGYDDLLLGRDISIVVDRRDGEVYREMWEGAIALKPDWILITSFNEWHEGSQIEPSLEHGDKYIAMTRDYAKKFKSGK